MAERQVGINQSKGGVTEGIPQVTEIIGRNFVGITTEFTDAQGNRSYLKEYFYECINGMIKIVIRTSMYKFSEAQLLLDSLQKIRTF